MSLRWYAFLCGFGSDVLFYNRPLKKHIILFSKCTSRLVDKRIHIKLVSSEKILHFGRPQTDFSGFTSHNQKKKKKKGPLLIFILLPLTFWIFHLFPFKFSFFSSFFLAPLFPVSQQKFSGEKMSGGYSAPACYTTAPDKLHKSHIIQYLCGFCKLQCTYCMHGSFCYSSCKAPSEYPQRYSNMQYPQHYWVIWDPHSWSENLVVKLRILPMNWNI